MITYRTPRSAWEGSGELALDLTPLLDILFIVLVFFILTANSIERVFELELPRDGVEQAVPLTDPETLTVALFKAPGGWAVGETRLASWDDAAAAIRSAHRRDPEARIVVVAERGASIDRLLKLLAFLRGEGLAAAHIMMDDGSPQRRSD